MKIKTLAITLLSSAILSAPVFAHIDKDETITSMKEMDKSSPANLSIQTSKDEMKTKSVDGLSNETEVVESSTKGAYIKIDDIKGESTRAADTISPDRIEFKNAIAAPDLDNDSDEDNDKPATDYNSSRSNKADGITAPDSDEDDSDSDTDTKATDYNSSRSNKNSKHSAFVDEDDSDNASTVKHAGEELVCKAETEKKVCTETEIYTTCECTHL